MERLQEFFVSTGFVYLAVAICAFAVSMLWADRATLWLHKRSLGQRAEVIRLMELMFMDADRKRVTQMMLAISFGIGSLVFLAFWPNLSVGVVLGSAVTIALWSLPKFVAQNLWERRCGVFVDQMVDGMTIMSNGVKSGLSVEQSMERVAENLANPISQEFTLVLAQMRLGRGLAEALNDLGMRIPRPDVQMFVTSVNILQETGGNMSETFQTINYTIRERQKIEKKIDALTAQTRMQGVIITMVPFIILVLFLLTDPAAIKPLFTTFFGAVMLVIILALQVIGGMMVRRIAKIEV